MAFGSVTLKAFAGASADAHGEAGNTVAWKTVIETWVNVTNDQWASVDLAYGSGHQTYSARVRLGHRLWPSFSMGLEAGAHGVSSYDAAKGNYDGQRAGGFGRYEWTGGEASLAVGATNDAAHEMGAYAAFCWLTRF